MEQDMNLHQKSRMRYLLWLALAQATLSLSSSVAQDTPTESGCPVMIIPTDYMAAHEVRLFAQHRSNRTITALDINLVAVEAKHLPPATEGEEIKEQKTLKATIQARAPAKI